MNMLEAQLAAAVGRAESLDATLGATQAKILRYDSLLLKVQALEAAEQLQETRAGEAHVAAVANMACVKAALAIAAEERDALQVGGIQVLLYM
jgi:hypothetical protein